MTLRTVLAAAALLALTLAASGGAAPGKRAPLPAWTPPLLGGYPDLDVRTALRPRARRAAFSAAGELAGASFTADPAQATPRTILRRGGALTAPSADAPEAIARAFLRRHADLYRFTAGDLAGLELVKAYRTRHNGAWHVYLRQTDAGREVHGSVLGFTIDRRGRIVSVGTAAFPGASGRASGTPALDAAAAVRAAAARVGARARAELTPLAEGDGAATFRNVYARGLYRPAPVTAELVTFPMPAGHDARLAWRTVIELRAGEWYESLVDASSGELLARENYYAHAGPQGLVFRGQHPDVAGATQQTTSFAGAAFNDAGWVTDRVTAGNNVNAYQDLDDSNAVGYRPQTPASGDPGHQHFDFTFTDWWRTNAGADIDLTDGYPDVDASITQLFYYTNVMHDWLYELGFDEPAGNFQIDNFGRGGAGNDPVLAEAQDGWEDGVAQNCTDSGGNPVRCQNNANFGTPADGSSPRMQMYMWAPSRPWRDGSMDGDVIAHEYGHGVSNRLVGGGSLGSGVQTGAMGEGWSDFISVSKWDDNMVGEYVTGNTTSGIRPFAFDASPLLYSDLCNVQSSGACQVHRDGQIWVAALYDMRTALVARYGNAGKTRAIRLVIDGMKSTVTSPSFLDARDGILAADVAGGTQDQCLVWGAFAGREMGLSASSSGSNDMSPSVATDGPAACTPTAEANGPYATVEGTDVTLSAAGSINPGDPINPPLTYAWDLDGDGAYDDATGASPSFTRVGQDGVFTVGLQVTNAYGFTDTDTATVTVANAAPTTTLDAIAPQPEGGTVSISGLVADPGWLDPLTATVDWGTGGGPQPLAGTLENVRPDATLAFAATHVYGDRGTFTVTVCAADDDTTGNCASRQVAIANVAPTAAIDTTGAFLVHGVPTFIAHAGQTVPFSGRSTDPGSDDLFLSWSWGDGPPVPDVTTTYLVNPPAADPFPSPSVQPRDVTDARGHAFADACLYTVVFSARDDDGGTASDDVVVLIAGNVAKPHGPGFWQTQYRPRPTAYSEAKRLCYLAIAGYLSSVFSEARPAATVAQAHAVLSPAGNGGDVRLLLDRELLGAWLDFADGAYEYDELFDTDGDGVAETTFAGVLAAAEAVRLNAAATASQLQDARRLLKALG